MSQESEKINKSGMNLRQNAVSEDLVTQNGRDELENRPKASNDSEASAYLDITSS